MSESPADPSPPTAPRQPAPRDPAAANAAQLEPGELRLLTVPVLISAVANLLAGYLWFLGSCFGLLVCAPLLVLATFELWTVARANRITPRELTRRVTVLGVCELLAGVFNLVSLVCATVALLNVGRIQRRLAAPGSSAGTGGEAEPAGPT